MEQLFPGLSHAPNLHPLVVHFPIAFWIAAAGAWVVTVTFRRERAWRFGLWLQTLGLAGATIAVGFGFWATETMGHDSPGHDLIHVHRDFMLVATGLALVITVVGWWRREGGRPWRVGLTVAGALLVGITTIGADRGAELVFRYGVGVAGEAPPHSNGHDEDEHSNGAHGQEQEQPANHARSPRPHGEADADE